MISQATCVCSSNAVFLTVALWPRAWDLCLSCKRSRVKLQIRQGWCLSKRSSTNLSGSQFPYLPMGDKTAYPACPTLHYCCAGSWEKRGEVFKKCSAGDMLILNSKLFMLFLSFTIYQCYLYSFVCVKCCIPNFKTVTEI